jgi:hypothetical protein
MYGEHILLRFSFKETIPDRFISLGLKSSAVLVVIWM